MSEFKMPSLGADMEAGTLVGWLKKPGDSVHRGESIAEVETDKGIIEIEAFADGTLERIVVPEGERVAVGTVLALIQSTASQPAASATPIATPAPTPEVAPETVGATSEIASGPGEPRYPASPAARRLAQRLGVRLDQLEGTGPGGVITRQDVENAAVNKASPTLSPPLQQPIVEQPIAPPSTPMVPHATGGDADRQARMRRTIAAAMTRSKREIPHYYLSHTIDLQPTMNWLTATNQQRAIDQRLVYGVMLLKAVALALRTVPELNTIWEGDTPVTPADIHIGTAISLRTGGLIAPALRHADQKSLEQLMQEFRDLVNRARSGGLKGSELSDPTITVTSLGERGVESVFGVIYPPQTAIVGFGKVVERPWSINGGLLSRQIITVTLSADHRISDGHRGGLFLAAIEQLLQEPEKL